MDNHVEILPHWYKLSRLVSDAIQSEVFRNELQNASLIQKLDILVNEYEFTDSELTELDKDLKMLAAMSVDLAFRWY